MEYLKSLWQKTYIDDIIERNKVRNIEALEAIIDSLCSAIGSLTYIDKIRTTLQSVKHVHTDAAAARLTLDTNKWSVIG